MLSENLKLYRKKKHLSSTDLSDISGISERNIFYIESGKSKSPKLTTLLSLSSALDVSIEDLIK